MSDTKAAEPVTAEAPKPEESAVIPAAETTAPAGETSTEVKPVEKVTEARPEETKKDEEESKESKPKEITHGTLSKAFLQFFKKKRYFFFQDELVPEDKLRAYLLKPTASKATAAYATQTGKGLWFYSKDESHKDAIHGIIKLADVTDVVAVGAAKFVVKLGAHELHFESPVTDRDNWVFSLKAKAEEAKATAESVVESEGYKSALEKLTPKPATTTTPKAPEKAPETTTAETPAEEKKGVEDAKAESPEKPVETAVASDEEASPSDTVKRTPSKSKKRGSVFGGLLGKMKGPESKAEKKDESKKEDEAKEEDAKPAEPATTETTAEPTAAAPETAETANPEETKPAEEPAAEKPEPQKRRSVFAFLGDKGTKKEEKKEEKAEEGPKEAPAVESSEASKPVDAPAETPVSVEPTSPTASSPKTKFGSFFKRAKSPGPKAAAESESVEAKAEPSATAEAEVPKETTAAETEALKETAKEETAAIAEEATATSPKTEKRRSIFAFKKEKEVKSDSEDGEGKKEGLLGGLMRRASAARAKSPGKESKEEKEVAAPAPVPEEPETSKAGEKAAEPAKAEAEPVTEGEDKPAQIGDVVPDAVTIGKSPTPVQAAA